MPSARASSTNASKSSIVPSSRCTAVWPPSALPMAHGLPGSSGQWLGGWAGAVTQALGRGREHGTRVLGGALRQTLEQLRALLEHALELGVVDGCLDLGVVAPRREPVGPRLDLELVVTDPV